MVDRLTDADHAAGDALCEIRGIQPHQQGCPLKVHELDHSRRDLVQLFPVLRTQAVSLGAQCFFSLGSFLLLDPLLTPSSLICSFLFLLTSSGSFCLLRCCSCLPALLRVDVLRRRSKRCVVVIAACRVGKLLDRFLHPLFLLRFLGFFLQPPPLFGFELLLPLPCLSLLACLRLSIFLCLLFLLVDVILVLLCKLRPLDRLNLLPLRKLVAR